MEISKEKKTEYVRRLLLSRSRLICEHPFYGLLLMHMEYAIDTECETAYTDGTKIAFSPLFLESLTDTELDFVMMHEVLHVALLHCLRGNGLQPERYNIACDIVVNSNIAHSRGGDPKFISIWGEPSMHLTPKGREGYLYTAEQVYEMLPDMPVVPKLKGSGSKESDDGAPRDGEGGADSGVSDKDGKDGKGGKGDKESNRDSGGKGDKEDGKGKGVNKRRAEKRIGEASGKGGWDDHTHWGEIGDDNTYKDVWIRRVSDAAGVVSVLDSSNSRGNLPACAARILEELSKPRLDWRAMLNDFIQIEICDYTFSPPDRRFDGCDFFLPDFNDEAEKVENILFMIDTSGSVNNKMVAEAYSEICGAITQFNGRLEGLLGFFDAAIYEPVPFASVTDVRNMRPVGGGGTDFHIIFDYIRFHMADNPPAAVVILTDGNAPYPDEAFTGGIPVLWIINNKDVTPPWGKVARM